MRSFITHRRLRAIEAFLRRRKFNSEERGCCGLAVTEARVIEVEDIATDMRFGKAWRDWMLASGIASMVSTPMVSPDGTVQGTIATCFPRLACLPLGLHL